MMKFYRLSGVGASLAFVLAMGATAPAMAKTVRHHHGKAHHVVRHSRKHGSGSTMSAELHTAQEQIRALQEQIEQLQARMNEKGGSGDQLAAAQQQAAEAQAAATAAQTQAAQAQQQAAAAQAEVAANDKSSKKAFKVLDALADTKISGRMYFNASQVSRNVNGAATERDGGFQIKRFYVGIDHKFNNVFAGNITTDVKSISGVGQALYIKKAYLEMKASPALIVRFGSADMPWIPYVEDHYGYRPIENTLIDRTNFGTSADWGIHFLGSLAGGHVSYQVSAVDGGGYRNPTFTKYIDVEGRLSLDYNGFYAGIGGYTGKRGAAQTGVTIYHTAERIDGLVGYKNKMFNIGGEYFYTKNWNNVTSMTQDSADGYSLFGNVNLAPKWSVFGRYDWVKPAHYTNNTLKDNYFNFGVQWEPVKIVDLALVYKRDAVDNGTFSTSNGTIGGGSLTVPGNGTYDEIGLFGQFRF